MKQMIILCALVVTFGTACTQKLKETEVPEAVKTSFVKNFPNVKSIKWFKENESEFEAEFKNGSQEQSVNFDATGKWLVTETEIKKSDLPMTIQATIKKEFSGFKIEEAEKVETEKGVSYEVELEKGERAYEIQFGQDGKVLKKEQKESEEKDGK